MEDARWLAPIVTDQSAFGGYYGQYYSGCLHFSRTFFPGSHFRLGRPGILGQLYFPESLKYETHICQLQVIGERHANGTRSWYACVEAARLFSLSIQPPTPQNNRCRLENLITGTTSKRIRRCATAAPQ